MGRSETIDTSDFETVSTGTYDEASRRSLEREFTLWNGYVLRQLSESDFPSRTSSLSRDATCLTDILRAIMAAYNMLHPVLEVLTEDRIAGERELNLACYEQHKTELVSKYLGRYIVIARGEIQRIGDSFDEVRDVSLDAEHRLLFRVEGRQPARGTLRWPMQKR